MADKITSKTVNAGGDNTKYSIVLTKKELKKLLLWSDKVKEWIFDFRAIVKGVSYEISTCDDTTRLFLISKF